MGFFIAAVVVAVIAVAMFIIGKSFRSTADSIEEDYQQRLAAYDPSADRYGNNRPAARSSEYDDKLFGAKLTRIIGLAATVVAIGLFIPSVVFTQGVGEAKVIVNVDGTIAGEKLSPGWGTKAPWQRIEDFDIFQQEVLFAGNAEGGAPSYSGGEVNGAEVTASVKNGAQAFIDMQVVYSIDPDNVTEIYKEYRSQERFTRQVVLPGILSTLRDVPSSYSPVQFRGEMRGEASEKVLDAMNDKLGKYGVEVSNVNLQDIRYTEQVEESIKNVEVAQQKEEQAQAELRATEVSAQAQVVEATAKAEANRLLTQSLTPEVLQQRYIDALGKGTVFVVPEGSTPLITTK